jgi:hypothetical protein
VQVATAQPLTSAPARSGAQTVPAAHVAPALHDFGLQRPLAASQTSLAPHEVAVQRARHIVPGRPQ